MTGNPLLVPLTTSALVVNDAYLKGHSPNIGRWLLDTTNPESLLHPPEPQPFLGKHPDPGVYLHWALPEALLTFRAGTPEAGSGEPALPLVPNRWLVTRSLRAADIDGNALTVATPEVTAWVIESDYLNKKKATSKYAVKDPLTGALTGTHIGRHMKVTEWNELGDGSDENVEGMFLTAIGPGLPSFNGYQPYNQDVFSFHDPLSDRQFGSFVVDYSVVGWYADSSKDILSSGKDIKDTLETLGWSLGDPEKNANDLANLDRCSLYTGTALRVEWNFNGRDPDPTTGVSAKVGVGHNSADAQLALGGRETDDAGKRLLQGFLNDLFHELETDSELMEGAVHARWFEPKTYDYVWDLTGAAEPGHPPTEEEIRQERDWLAKLNTAQHQYNESARHARGLQRRLYDLWRMQQTPLDDDEEGGRPANFDPSTIMDELGADLRATLERIKGIEAGDDRMPGLPTGDTEKEFADSLAQFVARLSDVWHWKLPEGREFKRVPLQSFYSPHDPAVVLTDTGAPDYVNPGQKLDCRTKDQLLTQAKINGNMADDQTTVDLKWLTQLPPKVQDVAEQLLKEFLLLSRVAGVNEGNDLTADLCDPGKSFKGVPGQGTDLWHQPWKPVYLLWAVHYYPVPIRPEDPENCFKWVFDKDKGRYRLTRNGSPRPIAPITLRGRSAMTALPQDLARGRATQHLGTYSDAPAESLAEFGRDSGLLGEISQAMEGFNLLHLSRASGYGIAPLKNTSLGSLLPGNPGDGLPVPDTHNMLNQSSSVFDPAMAGQFVFTQLTLVDEMGRFKSFVDEHNNQIPWRSHSVTPDKDPESKKHIVVGEEDVNADFYIQLPPRILQPSRLRFDYVSSTEETTVIGDPYVVGTAGEPAPTAVAGWLLVNHLTGSLLIHDQHGSGVIEGRAGLTPVHGERKIDWVKLPGCPYEGPLENALGEFAMACPELYKFWNALQKKDASAFMGLMNAIDGSAWTTDTSTTDGDALAPLVGRPVAVLRARLEFEIDTLSFTDPAWNGSPGMPGITDFSLPDYLKDRTPWPIKLGHLEATTDGLIGYFSHNNPGDSDEIMDYSRLYLVDDNPSGGDSDGYLQAARDHDLALPFNKAPVPEKKEERACTYVTMLADPWQNVHATSDILPMTSLRLPDDQIRNPLNTMRIGFRTGPLLAGIRQVADPQTGTDHKDDGIDSIVLPLPSPWTGTWDWAEPNENGTWETYPISAADTTARPGQEPVSARTGYLSLTTPLGGKTPPLAERRKTENS